MPGLEHVLHPYLLNRDFSAPAPLQKIVTDVTYGFSNLLSQYHITQSMSRAGTPRDNAVMENFFGRFKDTLRFHFRYWEKDDLRAVVADCVHYFNYVRPIRKFKGKPPVLFRSSAA